jgi:hypothetical protein
MRIKATSHLATLNHSEADLGILKRQQALFNSNAALAPDAVFCAVVLACVPNRLMSLLSINNCSRPYGPRYGMLHFRVFWRRLSDLKLGTAQSRLISRSRPKLVPEI